jgi:hypothetical protein
MSVRGSQNISNQVYFLGGKLEYLTKYFKKFNGMGMNSYRRLHPRDFKNENNKSMLPCESYNYLRKNKIQKCQFTCIIVMG